jgi:hypothetical protein
LFPRAKRELQQELEQGWTLAKLLELVKWEVKTAALPVWLWAQDSQPPALRVTELETVPAPTMVWARAPEFPETAPPWVSSAEWPAALCLNLLAMVLT